MRLLLTSSDQGRMSLLQSVLSASGIPFEVRNESQSRLGPGLAFDMEIWVPETHYADAKELLDQGNAEPAANPAP